MFLVYDRSKPVRPRALKVLGVTLIVFTVTCWLSILLTDGGTSSAWKSTGYDMDVIKVLLLMTAYYCVVSANLFLGKTWAWWGALLGLLLPIWFVAMSQYPFLFHFSMIFWVYLFSALYHASPRTDFIEPEKLNKLSAQIDDIALSLGLRWEQQTLWQSVQLATQGYVSDVVKQYREKHHVSWDEAELAIKQWIGNELELKMHLLKEWVKLRQPEVAAGNPAPSGLGAS